MFPVETVLLLEALTVDHRRAFPVLLEQTIEVGQVIETRQKGDLTHRIVRIQQELAGVADPHVDQELGKTFIGVLAEEMTKGRIAHIQQLGDLPDLDRTVGEIAQDVAVGRLQTLGVGFQQTGRIKAFTGQVLYFFRV